VCDPLVTRPAQSKPAKQRLKLCPDPRKCRLFYCSRLDVNAFCSKRALILPSTRPVPFAHQIVSEPGQRAWRERKTATYERLVYSSGSVTAERQAIVPLRSLQFGVLVTRNVLHAIANAMDQSVALMALDLSAIARRGVTPGCQDGIVRRRLLTQLRITPGAASLSGMSCGKWSAWCASLSPLNEGIWPPVGSLWDQLYPLAAWARTPCQRTDDCGAFPLAKPRKPQFTRSSHLNPTRFATIRALQILRQTRTASTTRPHLRKRQGAYYPLEKLPQSCSTPGTQNKRVIGSGV